MQTAFGILWSFLCKEMSGGGPHGPHTLALLLLLLLVLLLLLITMIIITIVYNTTNSVITQVLLLPGGETPLPISTRSTPWPLVVSAYEGGLLGRVAVFLGEMTLK
jgi:hypothetical protein